MIRKLKRRFIFVIMSFLLTVELIIFSVLLVMMYTSSRRALNSTLSLIVQTEGGAILGTDFDLGGSPDKPQDSQTPPETPESGLAGDRPQNASNPGLSSRPAERDPQHISDRLSDLRSAAAILYDIDGNVTKIITASGDDSDSDSLDTETVTSLIHAGKESGTVTLGAVSYRYLL